jgi:outer membrane protein
MKNLLPLLFIFLLNQNLFSQEKLTFEQCLDKVYENNPTLKKARLGIEYAKSELLLNKGKLIPSLYGIVDNRNSYGREIDPLTNQYIDSNFKTYNGNIGSLYTIFAGFTAWKSIDAAKTEVDINRMNVQKVKNDLTIETAQKFITVLYLQETVIVNQEQIAESEKLLQLADLKFKSGAIAENELFKIKAQKANEELTLTTNTNQLELNLIDLKQLMNLPLEDKIELEKPSFFVPTEYSLDDQQYEITEKAINMNPAYMISQFSEKKAKTNIGIARSLKMPTLNMRFLYGSNYSDTDIRVFNDQIDANLNYNIRLTLTIPIFSQFSTLAKVRESKTLYKQSILDRQIQKTKVTKEVLQAINNTRTAKKRMESLEISKDFSTKSYEADMFKYQLGKININELNITKTNLIGTQVQYIKAKHELLFYNALIKFYIGEKFEL